MSLLFSIPALFSLAIFCISILRKHVSHFPPPIKLISYVILIVSHLKWACNFLLYHSFSLQYSQQEELSMQRYKCREEEVECPVCLSVIEEGEEIRELRCEHLFHRDCLDRWVGYSRNVSCPLCSGSLFPCTTVLLGDENGVEVLFFKYSSFSSSRDHRDTWWLR